MDDGIGYGFKVIGSESSDDGMADVSITAGRTGVVDGNAAAIIGGENHIGSIVFVVVIDVSADNLQPVIDFIDTGIAGKVACCMGMEAEVEDAVVDLCHAAVSCCIINGILSFVKVDELQEFSLGVDDGDSQLVVVGIATAAKKQCFVVGIPMVGIAVSEEGVVSLVIVISPNGVFFYVVEFIVKGDE